MHPTQKQANPVVVTPADTLRHAAAYLARYGWVQGDYYFNPDADEDLLPAACVLGAIGMAVYGRQTVCPDDEQLPGFDNYRHAGGILRDYLRRTGEVPPRSDHSVGTWNDYPDQTDHAIIATLREAAQEWDRTHGGAA